MIPFIDFLALKTSKTDGNNSIRLSSSRVSSHALSPSIPEKPIQLTSLESGATPSSLSSRASAQLGSYIHQGLSAWPAIPEAATSKASSALISSKSTSSGIYSASLLNTSSLNASEPTGSPDLDINKASVSVMSVALVNGTSAVPITSAVARPVQSSANFANGTDFQAALSCWHQWDAYSDSASSTVCISSIPTTVIETVSLPSTLYDTYTLCDGVPRAAISNSTHPYVYTTVTMSETDWFDYTAIESSEVSLTGIPTKTVGSTVLSTYVYSEVSSYSCGSLLAPITTPTCSIRPEYCSRVWDAYSAAVSNDGTNGSMVLNVPPCTYSAPVTGSRCDSRCAVYVATVQLIYFPVSMTGDFCGDCRLFQDELR